MTNVVFDAFARIMRENAPSGWDAPLSVQVIEGQIVITIGVGTLALCHEIDDPRNAALIENGEPYVIVEDPLGFAKDVVRELTREKEDGSTPLNSLLIQVCEKAVDEGSLAVSVHEPEKDES